MLSLIRNSPLLLLGLQIFAALAVGFAAITHQSFWMDEGSTIFKALIPDLRDWWQMTLHLGGSDVQMPVYMFLVWAWEKLGMASEYSLRAVNLPWLLLGTLALRNVRFWPLVFLSSPFVWYYVGELRPYAMQAAAGALGAAALLAIQDESRPERAFGGLHAGAAAALLLCAASLTSSIWAAGLWIGILIIRPGWLTIRGFWSRIFPWATCALAFGAYYLFTILQGYRAAGNEGGVLSILFGLYELGGFAGLGPGRNELRGNPTTILQSLPLLIPAFVCIGGLWLMGMHGWSRKKSSRVIMGVACAVLAPLVLLATVGFMMDFRVLGRHLSPALPAVLLPLAAGLQRVSGLKIPWKILGIAALVFLTSSALTLRFAERHRRDDYRRASEIAFKALKEGKTVWWQADMNATRYYANLRGGMPLVHAIQVLESKPPSGLMFADVVVINRPDIRYRGSDYRGDLKQNFFRLKEEFTGFEVWTTAQTND